MSSSTIHKLSLSTDEMALVYSLLNLPTFGMRMLRDAYGDIQAPQIQEKLVTASHSLMARGIVGISDKGTVILDRILEKIFTPLIRFNNIIQTLENNSGKEGIITATDYYIGKDGWFSSHEIDMGVIHHLFHGEVASLSKFIINRLSFPSIVAVDFELTINATKPSLKMSAYPELEQMGAEKALKKLEKFGVDTSIAMALVEAIYEPVRKGSVVLVDASSETIEKKDLNKTGAGFFWLIGEKSSWIMAFERGDENATALILPGTVTEAEKLIRSFLK